MCGILGVVGPGVPDLALRFENALNSLVHRGPDDFGIYKGTGVLFGHRRLSIIDLNHRSAQPMHSTEHQTSILFNGEIYNFQELKSQLEQKGLKFRTTSDTEVLLYGLSTEGPSFLNKCIGMFAFGLYSHRDHSLLAGRDRLGVKPFYYHHDSERFIFSSEPKGILSLLSHKPQLNLSAVSSYFSFRYPVLDETFFSGIQVLPPGHVLKWKDGKISIEEFWDPAHLFEDEPNRRSESDYLDELNALMESAVKSRLVSDVPVAALLSGGLDSSVITYLMTKFSETQVRSYSIGFEERDYSELPEAKAFAHQWKTEHTEVILSASDYLDHLPHLIGIKDAPLSVPNEIAIYVLSRAIKKHATVVLSGEGSDEIFSGYGRIFRSTFDFDKCQEFAQRKKLSPEEELFLKKYRDSYSGHTPATPLEHFLGHYRYMPSDQKRSLFIDKDLQLSIDSAIDKKFSRLFERLQGRSYLNKALYTFQKIHMPGLLMRLDNATMAASVEGRAPFTDFRLVEFAAKLPADLKMKFKDASSASASVALLGSEISEKLDDSKYILRKLYEGRLGREVTYRKKKGFPVPLHTWITRDWPHVLDCLRDPKANIYRILDTRAVAGQLELLQQQPTHERGLQTWMLYNLELFLAQGKASF